MHQISCSNYTFIAEMNRMSEIWFLIFRSLFFSNDISSTLLEYSINENLKPLLIFYNNNNNIY